MNLNENEIGTIVVDCAVKLHMATGPGLLESVYEIILEKKLIEQGLIVRRQVPIPIVFEGCTYDGGFRADMIVEEKLIIELKSVDKSSPVHKKQLLTYLKLTNIKLGYLLNFGAPTMKEGLSRIINGHF